MTDSISRCELFNKLATIPAPPEANDFKAEVYKVIQQMETIDKWIPCSERLPDPNQYVLVTYKTTDEVHICQYYGDGSENPWYSLIDECLAWNNVVLAWMPLPKPYKERSK